MKTSWCYSNTQSIKLWWSIIWSNEKNSRRIRWIWTIYDIVEGRKQIDMDVYLPTYGKNLQRELVWTLEQKQAFIIWILRGKVIPNIAVIDYRDEWKPIQIIDGKQRISTIISFYNNEFPIVVEWEEYYYKHLPSKVRFLWEFLRGDIATSATPDFHPYEITDDDKLQWFEFINFSWTPQDIEHIKSFTKK